MHKFTEEKSWQGTAEALARHALEWMRIKRIGDPSFEPNERLVRDYVARGILSKPERKGKEAIFGFEQLAQFLACRAVAIPILSANGARPVSGDVPIVGRGRHS